ncbi:MAG TPA: hypothetical protein VL137_02685 [Polyangiaceae bacterium]|nr:hypothetical protein [Polyangiaceae bacterium]
MRRAPWILLPLLCVLVSPARAADDQSEVQYRPPPPERRGDFAVSLTLGSGLAVAQGSPNEVEKLNDPAFQQHTGAAFQLGNELWLGAALRDWFVLGFGLAQRGSHGGPVQVSTSSFITHLEFYPLFAQGGALRDLSIYGEFGAGSGKMVRRGQQVANAGVLSTIATGIVFEPLRWGGFAAGPALQYMHQFSPSLRADFVGLGFRVAFYASGN